MKNYILGIILTIFFLGCTHNHQINIGTISLNEQSTPILKHQEYYMSFTQEYYDNKLYPLSQYCNDQRTYLADDKFSTETYIKVVNERTKQSRVGKYPLWLLLNDDASNISCVKKSTNFINSEPFVVNIADNLSLKLFQKNEAKIGVPVKELGILIDFVSLLVPRTANFLLKTNNIIKNPIAQNYLNLMNDSFEHEDLDATKSRGFKSNIKSLKIKLSVPSKKGIKRELGYILLKPKYRTTLSTVTLENGIPNFRFIYNSTDPQIEDLMHYKLKNRHVQVQIIVDNFEQVSSAHVIEALASLDTHLTNRFIRFDRALILSLALRQSDLYKNFIESIRSKDIVTIQKYVNFFDNKQNPLKHLNEELHVTKCEYASLLEEAKVLIKNDNDVKETLEEQRVKNEFLQQQVTMRGIENFLSPVSKWNYIDQMFTSDITIITSLGKSLSVDDLKERYNREDNVSEYGCYVDLEASIYGTTVQEYLIHPSYVKGAKYNHMAISLNKSNQIDIVFYKFSLKNYLKIEKIFIDIDNRFMSRHRLKKIIEIKKTQNCSENIKGLL